MSNDVRNIGMLREIAVQSKFTIAQIILGFERLLINYGQIQDIIDIGGPAKFGLPMTRPWESAHAF
jgi:hypothetical protein